MTLEDLIGGVSILAGAGLVGLLYGFDAGLAIFCIASGIVVMAGQRK